MKPPDAHTPKLSRPPVQGDPTRVVGLFEAGVRNVYEFDTFTDNGRPKQEIIIGYDDDCDIPLKRATVSARHCRIVKQADGTYLVEDNGSTNGVWANDIPVDSAVLLPRMCLFFGDAEFYVLGQERRLPILAGTQLTFLAEAYRKYGTFERAAEKVGKSPSTIKRAFDEWRQRAAGAPVAR